MKTRSLESRRGRLINVGGVMWKWFCGRGGVVAFSEKGERKFEWASTIKGISPDAWDRGHWKKSGDGALTPGDVAKWLKA